MTDYRLPRYPITMVVRLAAAWCVTNAKNRNFEEFLADSEFIMHDVVSKISHTHCQIRDPTIFINQCPPYAFLHPSLLFLPYKDTNKCSVGERWHEIWFMNVILVGSISNTTGGSHVECLLHACTSHHHFQTIEMFYIYQASYPNQLLLEATETEFVPPVRRSLSMTGRNHYIPNTGKQKVALRKFQTQEESLF